MNNKKSHMNWNCTNYDQVIPHNSIKFILREDTLIELEEILPLSASPFITYLRSIRALHEICTARVLQDHSLVLYHFQVNFFYLYENFNLNMTLKVHIILHHYNDYFDWTGRTMRLTNGEFVESSHYSIKKEERTHGFKVKRAFGTPKHLEKSLKSLIWHNSKRAGFTPPSKLQLRKNSPYSSPYSSPFSSPSGR